MTSSAVQLDNAWALDLYGVTYGDLLRMVCIVADYRLFRVPIMAREVNGMLAMVGVESSGGLQHLERIGLLRYVGKSEHPNSKMYVPTNLALAKWPALAPLAKCGTLHVQQVIAAEG